MNTGYLVISSVLAMLCAICISPLYGDEAYDICRVSTMDKLRAGDSPSRVAIDKIELHAAQGEGESAQLAIRAYKEINNVRVIVSNLVGPNGFQFKPEVSIVGYTSVTNPSPGGFGVPGLYADPLIPMKPFDIEANAFQGLWITAWVPENAPAGWYKGTISVSPEGQPRKIVGIRLRVYDVRIPRQSALKTCFLQWNLGKEPENYGDAWTERMSREFSMKALRYRMSVSPPLPWDKIYSKNDSGVWSAKWDRFDAEVNYWLARGVTFFSIGSQTGIFPYYGGGGGPLSYEINPKDESEVAARAERQAKLKLLNDHLVEKDWTDLFALYIYDEPIISPDYPNKGDTAGPDNVHKVKALAEFVHRAAPKLRTLFVTTDPAYEAVALDYPTYCWVPHINHFHADFQQSRQKIGEESWMYQCVTTLWVPEYPDIWRIDRTGTSHRVTGWWLWKYRCDGFLFWCIDYWVRDPWKNASVLPDFPTGNGEGFFFYPDPEKKALPFASIRAEIIRDSFEDYDLLTMLEKKISAAKKRAGSKAPDKRAITAAEKLLKVDDIVQGLSEFSTDPAIYESKHRELLKALESLK